MSYFVFCTFDLKHSTSEDYRTAYTQLAAIGLKRVIVFDQSKNLVIPTTAVAGEFNGTGAGDVRTAIRDRVKNAFAAHGFSSEIFVVVGGDWAWGAATT